MLKYLVLLLLFAACQVPTDQTSKTDCAKLKNDSFFYYSELSARTYRIHRNDSIQSETDNLTGEIFKFRIQWTDSCAYKMYPLDENPADTANRGPGAGGRAIEFRVLSQTPDYYIFEASKDNFARKIADTLFFIRN